MNLRSDAAFAIGDGTATARLMLRAGESRTFALGYDDHAPAVFARLDADQIDETVAYWREWSSQLECGTPYRKLVMRSALVLKLLWMVAKMMLDVSPCRAANCPAPISILLCLTENKGLF